MVEVVGGCRSFTRDSENWGEVEPHPWTAEDRLPRETASAYQIFYGLNRSSCYQDFPVSRSHGNRFCRFNEF